MKKKIAIIAEYNPFHNGHKLQLEIVKKTFQDCHITIFLSATYSQRGEIIIQSFDERKACALANGADQVVKLSNNLVVQGASSFTKSILNFIQKESKTDYLVFGSEINDPQLLLKFAKEIQNNQEKRKELLKEGHSNFKIAFALAKTSLGANDILGLNYLWTHQENKYAFKLLSHKREINYYHGKEKKIASASMIRKMLSKDETVENLVPCQFKAIKKEIDYFFFQAKIIFLDDEKIEKHKNFEKGMANLFKKHIYEENLANFLQKVTSKRYSRAKIRRCVVSIIENLL